MMNKIRYGNSVIQYSVVKSKRRKTSEIIVDKNGVIVRTPNSKPLSEIKKIVKAKSRWIFKKQHEFSRPMQYQSPKTYTQKFIKNRIKFYSSKLDVKPEKIVIKKMKSRWGSATRNGIINLNVNLLKAPRDVIDYVMLHEACHLRIRNHSYRFWNLVSQFMPLYEEQKNWLNLNSNMILD